MRNTIKIVLICFLWFTSFEGYSQLDEYIKLEENRINNSKSIEQELQLFIQKNYNSYSLTTKIKQETIEHLRKEEEFSDKELELALKNAKIVELRKLFFKKYSEKKKEYIANPIPDALKQSCVNGDFENGTASYTFWSDAYPQPATGTAFFQSCATPTAATATNVITPSVNNFNSTVTLINSTAAGYQQYDPVLASFGQNVPTLNTNGGNKSIKLNNAGGFGSSDITTMSRTFANINEPTIDFNFSLIMDNKPAHGQDIQPFFRVRAYDQNNNVVDEICIIADPDNCLFNRIDISSNRRMLYTGWLCARLNVQDILNQPGRIEFTISDCMPSQHFGTVYIDNICGIICATPQLGALSIDPVNFVCPDASSTTPLNVCGTYQTPANATLGTLTLDIIQNGTVVSTIGAPTQLTANTFCFTFLPNLFGASPSGDFEFEVNAIFNVNCSAGTYYYNLTDSSSSLGPDVTFSNCCLPTLVLTSPADNVTNLNPATDTKKERSDWIKATNIVEVGNNVYQNGVVYHAGNYIELNPGFEAVMGSQFAAYIEGCSTGYIYRTSETSITNEIADEEIHLVKREVEFYIVPNPSSSSVELIMKDNLFKNVTITTIDGKMVYDKNIELTDRTRVDVSRYANGIYIINLLDEDGNIYSKKLIKN
ncbi:3-coathanger stack domain-containing protein [Flavobacterium capsici]|uniref:T9SS type A sorting domain-containing protein n=1 Tax=Flavobacterium capsici TaxID=3075618 RepID=A0AA96F0J9_9FLAO|nr:MULTISPECIES: 3-coathanger stack domain-containing protein [unclassified Flavobacterium]WNM20199.1 T9SS type A sorting domain-containing protein [Flavobacterium sp. PMR2A8]WNM21589.1 T9SS type A sorting domain-containing protein [Flavobacterium sp. PMTSA4]